MAVEVQMFNDDLPDLLGNTLRGGGRGTSREAEASVCTAQLWREFVFLEVRKYASLIHFLYTEPFITMSRLSKK
jgi:hypothetical protein